MMRIRKGNWIDPSSFVSFLLLASAAWSSPWLKENSNTTDRASSAVGEQYETETEGQYISGKITSLERNSFTLMVTSERTSRQLQLLGQAYAVKVMSFQIDDHTNTHGKIRVGANADVTYRVDGGKNIATSVRVRL
jgi:hypothetical protein